MLDAKEVCLESPTLPAIHHGSVKNHAAICYQRCMLTCLQLQCIVSLLVQYCSCVHLLEHCSASGATASPHSSTVKDMFNKQKAGSVKEPDFEIWHAIWLCDSIITDVFLYVCNTTHVAQSAL